MRATIGSGQGVILAMMATASLGGCASFRGEPAPIVPPVYYDETTVLSRYTGLEDENARVAYRNEVAYRWIAASDQEFAAFRHGLSQEMKGVNVGSNLAVLIMNGAAAVSGAEGARALAIGSSTVVGANATLNRDAFLDQSIATALTTAQANRMNRLTEIRRRLLQDTARQYPLGDALIDIRELNASASINNATAQMAATAAADLREAQENASAVVAISAVSPDVHAVRASFSSYVLTVEDTAILDRLAAVLDAKSDPVQRLYQQNIMDAYAARAEGGADVVNALNPALKSITGKEFKL